MPVIDEKQELAKKSDLATKQDILTPGTGITIQNNVISATGTGGSTVTVTPVLSTGTRIAAMEVDGTIYTLFAPTPPSVGVTQVVDQGVELARVIIDGVATSIYAPESSTVLSGTSAPSSSLGEDNNLYVQYTVTSGVYTVDMTYVKLNGAWVELSAGGGGGNVDDVNVNGVSVLDANKIAQITSYKEVTQAEYDALPASKESDNVLYCIKDKATADTTVAPVIYSEEEREVGVWTDGKPLYQKTFITTTPSTVDLQTIVADAANLAIDTVVLIHGFLYSTSLNQFIPIEFPFSTDVLLSTYLENQKIMQMVPSSNYTNCAESITIQYTKTTDTPGSGKYAPSGVPAVHYSENEQVVGTWIDGSTIYERTYTGISFEGTSDTTIVDANIKSNSGIYNVKSITGLWSIGNFGYLDATIQAFGETGIFNDGSQTLYARVTPNGLAVVRTNTNFGYGAFLTVRYTKSTS